MCSERDSELKTGQNASTQEHTGAQVVLRAVQPTAVAWRVPQHVNVAHQPRADTLELVDWACYRRRLKHGN